MNISLEKLFEEDNKNNYHIIVSESKSKENETDKKIAVFISNRKLIEARDRKLKRKKAEMNSYNKCNIYCSFNKKSASEIEALWLENLILIDYAAKF